MKQYLGVKLIQAEPQTKDGGDGYAVVYSDGYESWSPKSVFEEAYRKIDALTFGLAIEAMKKGMKVARKGWNDKGMWLGLVKSDNYIIYDAPYQGEVQEEDTVGLLPWIGMKTADGNFIPWLASQTDMLAEDWEVVI